MVRAKRYQRWWKRLPAILFSVYLGAAGAAEPEPIPFPTPSCEIPRVLHFDRTDYHAGSQNWSITQGSDGFIYVANNNGLLQYDGHRWSLHPFSFHQRIRSVAAGPGGRIYAGAFNEFGFWEKDPYGRLRFSSLAERVTHPLFEREEIWHILPCDSTVLFQSFSTLYLLRGDRIRTYPLPGNIMFVQRTGDRFHLPVIGQGLYELSLDGSFRLVPGSEFLARSPVSALVEVGERLWVGTKKDGIFIQRENGTWTPWSAPVNERLKEYELNKAIVLKSGLLALGTIRNGVFIVNRRGNIIHHLRQGNGLQNNTVLALFEDREQNLWVGLDKGIDLVLLSEPLLYHFDEEGVLGTVFCAEVFSGRLYLGTNQGLFVRRTSADRPPEFDLVPGTVGQVWDLKVTTTELLCGHNDGTFAISRTGDVRKISEVNGGWSFAGDRNRPDEVLQGTYSGIARFVRRNGRWSYAGQLARFPAPIKKLIPGEGNWFWAQPPHKGLYRVRLNEDWSAVDQYTSLNGAHGLEDPFQIFLSRLPNYTLVRTGQHNKVWSDSQEILSPLPGSLTGAAEGRILAPEPDDWFEILSDEVRLFSGDSLARRLPLSLVDGYEFIRSFGDYYLFCLEEGYALLPKDPPPQSARPARLLIRSVRIFRGNQAEKADFLPVEGGQEPVRLPRGVRQIRIELTCPRMGKKPQYRYRIENLQPEWTDWKDEPVFNLVNLPAGEYGIIMESSLASRPVRYEFSVQAPWYLSPWGMAIGVVLLLVFFFTLYLLHQARLTRERWELKREKRKELQQARMKAQNKELEIHLNQQSRELVNTAYNLARKNEVLGQVKKELSDISDRDGFSLPAVGKAIQLINQHLDEDKDRKLFDQYFNQVHGDFFKRLKADFPDLTPGDLQMAAFLKMNLSTKEIAPLLHISVRGVENKRYRLRKKMNLAPEENLNDFFIQY